MFALASIQHVVILVQAYTALALPISICSILAYSTVTMPLPTVDRSDSDTDLPARKGREGREKEEGYLASMGSASC